MDLGLKGRTVLVTGGTRGIGRAIALSYAREGARVAITWSNDERAAHEVATEVRGAKAEAFTCRLALSDSSIVERSLHEVVGRFGGLDILVANAVRWPHDDAGPLDGVSWGAWKQAARANLEGTVDTVRVAIPHLTESDAGRIVLVSSGVSRDGMAGASSYSTAKAALDGLVATLKWELAGVSGLSRG